MIPAEAVEAAAFELYRDDHWGTPDEWPSGPFADDQTLDEFKSDYLKLARAALEAAAPYILAQAWEEGYTLGYADCANKQESNRPNPYMLNNEGEK